MADPDRTSDHSHRCQGADSIVGTSCWAFAAREYVRAAAAHQRPALLVGPPGSGKSHLARAIHAESTRRSGPFVPVRCLAVETRWFASQVFGTAAVPDAGSPSLGCVRAAHGGTIYFDAVDRLTPEMQARLVDLLRTGQILPEGAAQAARADVRLIAGSAAHLDEAAGRGEFSADLFELLREQVIEVTSLESRTEDIQPLAVHFLSRHVAGNDHLVEAALASAQVQQLLCRETWPDNVRGLKAALAELIEPLPEESTTTLSGGSGGIQNPLSNGLSLPAEPWVFAAAGMAFDPQSQQAGQLQRERVRRALYEAMGNRDAAAELLGVQRAELDRQVSRFGLAGRPHDARAVH